MSWQPNQGKVAHSQRMATPGSAQVMEQATVEGWKWAAFVTVTYLLAAQISLTFIIEPEGIAVFWLASGVSLSVLVLTSRNNWAAVLLAVLLVNLFGNMFRGYNLPVSAGFALANVAAPLLGASLLRYLVGRRVNLQLLFHSLSWILAGAAASSAMGAFIGATTATLSFQGAAFWQVWQLWWINDFIGVLVAGSLILTLASPAGFSLEQIKSKVHSRSVFLFALLCVVSTYVFAGDPERGIDLLVSPYLVFPILLWMTLQCGAFGAAIGGLAVTLISVWGMINGLGPFVEPGALAATQALAVQLFLAVVMVSLLLLASVIGERNEALASQQVAKTDLKKKLGFERLLSQISKDVINRPSTEMDRAIDTALEKLGKFYAVDRVAVAEFSRDKPVFKMIREWCGNDVDTVKNLLQAIDRNKVPWITRRLFAGECVVIEDRDEMPAQAGRDRHLLESLGDRSLLLVPIFLEARLTAMIGFSMTHSRRRWSAAFIDQAQMIGQALAAAVSRRRQEEVLEERLQDRTAELSALNMELQAFSYSVSHDLRAPLRRIDSYTQMLEEDCKDRLDAEGREHLSRIRKGTQHMDHLIEDMLQLSVITRRELQRRTLNLSALAEDIVATLQDGEPARIVETRIQPTDDVSGDAGLLTILLENLLANAWKFTARNDAPVIEFGQIRGEGVPTFFVRDNGAGFDMEYADKLFGAFQRLHKESDYAGTGIGLATARRIVNRHGGSIWAEARVGEGAVFYFTLGKVRDREKDAGRDQPA